MVARVRSPAPLFTATMVHRGHFEQISLEDLRGKWVCLLFYPADFTYVCPAEIIAFDRLLPTFAALNTEVLAISTDSEYSHLAWANTKREEGGLGPNLRLRLLADKSMKIARDYNVLLEEEGVALRAMFIIDPQGIIRQMTVNDIAVGRSTEEALRLIRALQFTHSHGDEVCPADWTPGSNSAAIRANPEGSREWFANNEGKQPAAEGTLQGAPDVAEVTAPMTAAKRPSSSGSLEGEQANGRPHAVRGVEAEGKKARLA